MLSGAICAVTRLNPSIPMTFVGVPVAGGARGGGGGGGARGGDGGSEYLRRLYTQEGCFTDVSTFEEEDNEDE